MPWTPNLSVGVTEIDEQHKIWFEKAEKLFEAGRNQKTKEYIGELLTFLSDYTKKHFADEERYMLKINYPGYKEQKTAHENFITQLNKINSDYKTSGGSLAVIINSNHMVVDWLTKHITVMDKQIGEFAKKNK